MNTYATERSRWIKLIWSITITVAIALFFITRSNSRFTTLDSRFVLFLLTWGIVLICSPIILLLRLTRLISDRGIFLYILTGTMNGFIGIIGLIEILRMGIHADVYQETFLLTVNLLVAAFIFVDAFVKELPGFRKKIAGPGVLQKV